MSQNDQQQGPVSQNNHAKLARQCGCGSTYRFDTDVTACITCGNTPKPVRLKSRQSMYVLARLAYMIWGKRRAEKWTGWDDRSVPQENSA